LVLGSNPGGSTAEWLTWGECVTLCESRNLTRKMFAKLATAKDPSGAFVLERRLFPGCRRQRYRAASLHALLH